MNTENNILIAEFMGAKYDKDVNFPIHPDDLWLPIHGICNIKGMGKTLKYHKSWDWLMSVVDKIESLEKNNAVIVYATICYINAYEKYSNELIQFKTNGETKIQAVYNAVVEFIKWYNQQNK